MGAVLKRVRRQEAVNRAGRRVIAAGVQAGRGLERLAFRWRAAGPVTVEIEGRRFRMIGRCDDLCLDALWVGYPWARGELRLMALLAPRARTILDIGANTGVFTLLVATANTDARVVAFEPHPANFERLSDNLRLNGVGARVRTVQEAVGEVDGPLAFTIPADGALSDVASVFGDFSRAHYGIEYRAIEVEGTTLDSAAGRLGLADVDLVKLDVEYHEAAALEGARATLDRWSPVVLAEVFNPEVIAGDKPELAGRLPQDNAVRVEVVMRELGYHGYAVGDRGLLSVPSLRGQPQSASSYVFTRTPLEQAYTPFSDVRAIEGLLGEP